MGRENDAQEFSTMPDSQKPDTAPDDNTPKPVSAERQSAEPPPKPVAPEITIVRNQQDGKPYRSPPVDASGD